MMSNGPQPTGYDWLASGGAYWVIAAAWILSAILFGWRSLRAGNRTEKDNDGCLLAICSIVLTLTGGGMGLYAGLALTHYPTFVLTSILGCVLVPGIGSLLLNPRIHRRR